MNTVEIIAFSLIGIAVLSIFSATIYVAYNKKSSNKKGNGAIPPPTADKGKIGEIEKNTSLQQVRGLPTILFSVGFAFMVIAILLLVSANII
ncbi:MAG TPA: hypothetical protein DCK95_03345 [Anaerolineaceae bacterium]|nr:hypothetical protein [Anaerolineaceae bacterium]